MKSLSIFAEEIQGRGRAEVSNNSIGRSELARDAQARSRDFRSGRKDSIQSPAIEATGAQLGSDQ